MQSGRKPGEIPEAADSSHRFLRAWIHLVRGLLREHRGDAEKAKKSFIKAWELLPDSFVSALAETRLDAHDKSDDAASQADGMDPAIRRKRKKRR